MNGIRTAWGQAGRYISPCVTTFHASYLAVILIKLLNEGYMSITTLSLLGNSISKSTGNSFTERKWSGAISY